MEIDDDHDQKQQGQQPQEQQEAVQSFMEFTGNQSERDARSLLLKCNWDVQRAINLYFMRGQPQQQQKELGFANNSGEDNAKQEDANVVSSRAPTSQIAMDEAVEVMAMARMEQEMAAAVRMGQQQHQQHQLQYQQLVQQHRQFQQPAGPQPRQRISHFNRFATNNMNSQQRGLTAPFVPPRRVQQPPPLQTARRTARGGRAYSQQATVVGSTSDPDVQMLDGGSNNNEKVTDGEQQAQAAQQPQVNGREPKQPPSTGEGDAAVRAPIPAVRGVMLAQSFDQTYRNGRPRTTNPIFEQFYPMDSLAPTAQATSTSMAGGRHSSSNPDFRQLQTAHRTAMNRFHQQQPRNNAIGQQQQPSAGDDVTAAGEAGGGGAGGHDAIQPAAATGGFGHGLAKATKDLRILFRPPVDMIFFGDWNQALQVAQQKNVWLMVNVQKSTEFSSAVLNRDIWSAEMVKELIRPNFLFWQIYHDSADGVRIRGYYGFDNYPIIFIVDPRTGEEVLKLPAPDVATFLENLTTFLDRYPTLEARDQEFRELAMQGRLLPEKLPKKESNNDRPRQQTSPVGSKKRKQPGLGGGVKQQPGCAVRQLSQQGDVPAEDDDAESEANRQAKKMKQITIEDDMDMQPSTSSALAAWSPGASQPKVAAAAAQRQQEDIEQGDWRKWEVSANSSSKVELARVQLQFRLPDGRRHRVQLWAQAPLSALFSLIASLGLRPADHQLVLDFPRREFAFNPTSASSLLTLSLETLGFGPQEMVNVERRAAIPTAASTTR